MKISNFTEDARVGFALQFFNSLYGAAPKDTLGCLWTSPDCKSRFFNVSNEDGRRKMAKCAIKLNESGQNVFCAVNLQSTTPAKGRGKEIDVTFQTALICDIDIEGGKHISDDKKKYAPDFAAAQSFLPFPATIVVDSGWGLHGYLLFSKPLPVTDENRKIIKAREGNFLSAIRQKAGQYSKIVDGVGDLARVLRVPGTFNFKLGVSEEAPLCSVKLLSDRRFTPEEIDQLLKTQSSQGIKEQTPSHEPTPIPKDDYDKARAIRMLDFISPDLPYADWLALGMALKNIGFDCSVWSNFSRGGKDFKEGECEKKWAGFHGGRYTIATIHEIAKRGGYDEKTFRDEYYNKSGGKSQLSPRVKSAVPQSQISEPVLVESKSSAFNHAQGVDAPTVDLNPVPIEKNECEGELQSDLKAAKRALTQFKAKGAAAIEKIKNLTEFSRQTLLDKEYIETAALTQIFDKLVFNDLCSDALQYGKAHPDDKVNMMIWRGEVKAKTTVFKEEYSALKARVLEVQSRIESQKFFSANGLSNFVTPPGYSITEEGIFKLVDEKEIQISRRAGLISQVVFAREARINKLSLAHRTSDGWEILEEVEQAVVFNNRKLVDLANKNFPVTSCNAALFVEFLDAFYAANQGTLPMIQTVASCGWHFIAGKKIFVDPRRETYIEKDGKACRLVVESKNEFAKHLKTKGSFLAWRSAYEKVKDSPLARGIVAASIASPLLSILGERNFAIYVLAPTTAGKTTILELGASAVGSPEMMRSLDATRLGLVGLSAQRNHFTVMLDEKQVADEKLADNIPRLIYAHSNGEGRTRCSRSGDLNSKVHWNNIMIMNGETGLFTDAVTGGAYTRALVLKTDKMILSPATCEEIRDIIKDNYGHIMPLFIEEIEKIGDGALNAKYKEIKELCTGYGPGAPKLRLEHWRYVSVLTLADVILNTLLGKSKVEALVDAADIIGQLTWRVPTVDEISDTRREIDFVCGFIAQNQNRFIGGEVSLDKIQQIYGKIDEKNIYITVPALKEACKRSGFDYHKLVGDLVADKFFSPSESTEKDRGRRDTVKARIGKVAVWCYKIDKSKIETQ